MPHRTPRTQAIKHGFTPAPQPAWNAARNAPVSMVGTAAPHYPLGREREERADLQAAFDRELPQAPGTGTGSKRR